MESLQSYADSTSDDTEEEENELTGDSKARKLHTSSLKDVNTAGKCMISTKPNPKTVLDEHKAYKSKEMLIEKSGDFFALNNSSSSDESELDEQQIQKNQSQRTDNTDSSKISETPKSSFWLGKSRVEDWDNPESIWHTNSDPHLTHKRKATVVASIQDPQVAQPVRKRTASLLNTGLQPMDNKMKSLHVQGKCYIIHRKVAPYLNEQVSNVIPSGKHYTDLLGHEGAVNRVQWCKSEYSHLLMSAGMDRTLRIWNTFASINHQLLTFSNHTKAVKDCAWVNNSRQVLSASFDRTVRLWDVEKGEEVCCFELPNFATCLEAHPVNPNLFLVGSLNQIACWDMRGSESHRKVFTYKESFGQVQDIAFLSDGLQFFTCNDLVSRDSSDRNIMAWDFNTGVVLSNQIYQERYTCTRLRLHPQEAQLLAQTNGGYIARFSTIPPYKMDKATRYQGHKMEGYSIGCDISRDGHLVVSGSSDGQVLFYDYFRGKIRRQINVGQHVCMDIACHPVLPATVAVSTWGGTIRILH